MLRVCTTRVRCVESQQKINVLLSVNRQLISKAKEEVSRSRALSEQLKLAAIRITQLEGLYK